MVFANKVTTDTISIRNFKSGLQLEKLWKYSPGDDRSKATPSLDDSKWRRLFEDNDENDTLLKKFSGIVWFRTSFVIDSSISGASLVLQMRTNGACDVFIDGKLVHSFGVVGKTDQIYIIVFLHFLFFLSFTEQFPELIYKQQKQFSRLAFGLYFLCHSFL